MQDSKSIKAWIVEPLEPRAEEKSNKRLLSSEHLLLANTCGDMIILLVRLRFSFSQIQFKIMSETMSLTTWRAGNQMIMRGDKSWDYCFKLVN